MTDLQSQQASPVRVLRAGDDAVLLDCAHHDEAARVFELLRAAAGRGELAIDELVPAARTVLVLGGEARDIRAFRQRLGDLIARHSDGAARGSAEVPPAADTAATITIPVVYEGIDLEEVARLAALSPDEIIARHTAAHYRVAFTGFAPGFAYLTGGDPGLAVPRHATPRTRIPRGSVGLAEEFTGVYPEESPGGWQLIGRTDVELWNAGRTPPALLIPGGRVRFVARREQLTLGERATPTSRAAHESTMPAAPAATADPVLTVTNPGLLLLVQDEGRPGLASLGVSGSGAADRDALHLANRLVGNPPGAAALEFSLGVVTLEVVAGTTLAFAGAIRTARVTGHSADRTYTPGEAFQVVPGEHVEFDHPARGLRTVLAVRGGVSAETVLGSASRDTLSRLGPEPLRAGSEIRSANLTPPPAGTNTATTPHSIGSETSTAPDLPAPGEVATLEVVPGPREDWFTEESLVTFFGTTWEVSLQSDRVGVRLTGPALEYTESRRGTALPSEGLTVGAIQVPPDGHPIVFLADHPVTGGYPVVGTLPAHALPLAAQLPPGSLVRFARLAPES